MREPAKETRGLPQWQGATADAQGVTAAKAATLARVSDVRRQSRKYFANALRTTRSTFVADRISKKAGCARACDSPEGDVCAKRNFPVLRVVDWRHAKRLNAAVFGRSTRNRAYAAGRFCQPRA